jgi:hypothetical protein
LGHARVGAAPRAGHAALDAALPLAEELRRGRPRIDRLEAP